jgi:RimJ/RimL family protein N-acetyltransferase
MMSMSEAEQNDWHEANRRHLMEAVGRVGAALARHGLRQALEAGLQKVVVEVVSEQEGAIRMFTDLGFRGEAVLVDHIRDRSGQLQDLLVLAHAADDEWATMSSLGVGEEVG